MTRDLTKRYKEIKELELDTNNAIKKFFNRHDKVIGITENMFKIIDTTTQEEQDMLAVVDYKLGLLFLYELKYQKFEHKGTLVSTQVIGSQVNTFELVGDGAGRLELKRAELNYIFESQESYAI